MNALAEKGCEVHFVVGRFWGLKDRLKGLGMKPGPYLKIEPVCMAQTGPGLALPFNHHGVYNACALARLKRLAGRGLGVVWVRHLKLADFLLAHTGNQGLKLVYEAHEIFSQTAREEGMAPQKVVRLKAMEQRVIKGVDKVAAISQPLAHALSPMLSNSAALPLVPSGVDQNFFLPLERQRQSGLVVYAGSLAPWKGVDLLIKALARTKKVSLEILGGEENSPDWLRIEQLAAGLSVKDRLVMSPRAGQEKVRDLLARAEIAVWPGKAGMRISAEFTSPLKLFEYLASGCAVVAPDLPAARAVLTPDRDAMFFKPDDPDSLAIAMDKLVEDAEMTATLGKSGQKTAEKYTWERRAQTMISVIKELSN
jgi:glycosyltransferase involved in cell wall biosynthesis